MKTFVLLSFLLVAIVTVMSTPLPANDGDDDSSWQKKVNEALLKPFGIGPMPELKPDEVAQGSVCYHFPLLSSSGFDSGTCRSVCHQLKYSGGECRNGHCICKK